MALTDKDIEALYMEYCPNDSLLAAINFARAIEARVTPRENPVNCLEAGPGKGLCDQCAMGRTDRCRYVVPLDEQKTTEWVMGGNRYGRSARAEIEKRYTDQGANSPRGAHNPYREGSAAATWWQRGYDNSPEVDAVYRGAKNG